MTTKDNENPHLEFPFTLLDNKEPFQNVHSFIETNTPYSTDDCVMFSFKIRPKTYTSSNWITEKATWQVMPSVHPRPNPFHPTPLNSLLDLISYW